MGKTVVILQSNYLPWKGYMDLMNAADTFVLFDDVQYTRRDWRNRNRVPVNGALKWLTIPVQTKGNYTAAINEITVSHSDWCAEHFNLLERTYGASAGWAEQHARLEELYGRARDLTHLSDINHLFLSGLRDALGIKTKFAWSHEVAPNAADPTGRLVEICAAHDAAHYISGPAARSYIDAAQFTRAGITLSYADYGGYPTYAQNLDPFEHGVSVLDPLLQFGAEATRALTKTMTAGEDLPFIQTEATP